MWLLTLFDLPVKTKPQRKAATNFRNSLLRDGFFRMQYSVYARYCPSDESATTHGRRIKDALPTEGHVRCISITDRQFKKMKVYVGKQPKPVEKEPSQLVLL